MAEFGPSSAAKSRHYPFWHLAADGNGALWELSGLREFLKRPAGATPSLTELRAPHINGGFPADIDDALRHVAGLLQSVASRVLDAYFPLALHADIVGHPGPGPRRAERSSRGDATHDRGLQRAAPPP